jgi:hypothetical protein
MVRVGFGVNVKVWSARKFGSGARRDGIRGWIKVVGVTVFRNSVKVWSPC